MTIGNPCGVNELLSLLETVPEAHLKVLGLLRQSQPHPGQLLPRGYSRAVYTQAALEMVEYSRACADLAERIKQLTPAQAASFPIPEYGL